MRSKVALHPSFANSASVMLPGVNSPLANASIFRSSRFEKFVLELRFTLIAAIAAIPRMATMLKIFFLILLWFYFIFLSVLFQVYILSTREMTCVSKFLIFTLSSFLGDGVVSEVFLLGLFRHRHFLPFIVFIGFDFFILSRNLLASGRATWAWCYITPVSFSWNVRASWAWTWQWFPLFVRVGRGVSPIAGWYSRRL